MATDKIPSGVRFGGDIWMKLSYIAKYNHRSLNAQMEMLAEECIRAFEKENGEITVEMAEALGIKKKQ